MPEQIQNIQVQDIIQNLPDELPIRESQEEDGQIASEEGANTETVDNANSSATLALISASALSSVTFNILPALTNSFNSESL